jgi:hypothetical protein
MTEVTESPPLSGRAGQLVPCPAAIALLLVFAMMPLVLAAGMPLLPEVLRGYLVSLPLPVLVAEFALLFMIFVHPLMISGRGECPRQSAAGICRGLLLGCLAMPFMIAAREVRPLGGADAAWIGLLIVVTGAGAASASLAWGPKGAALCVALCCLPGVIGYVAQDVYPAMSWSMRVCPLAELASAEAGGPSWLAFLPGLVLAVAGLAAGRPKNGD